jgi:hypothetical protein
MISAGAWTEDESLHKLSVRSDYRTSNQASLWRKDQYLSLLFEGCTTWDFELIRAVPLRCFQIAQDAEWPVKYVYRQLPEWKTEPVVRGKFTIAAQKYIEREGIDAEISHHPDGTPFDGFKNHGIYIHESFEED